MKTENYSPKRMNLRRLMMAVGLAPVLAAISWCGLNFLFPFPVDKLSGETPPTIVRAADGTVLRIFPEKNDYCWIPKTLDHFSPALLEATIAVEDKRFYRHHGVDLLAVMRAGISNVINRRVVSGASTITMQVIRLLTPRPRTLRSKIIEIFRAIQLERIRSKQTILEIYLNRAPYGGTVYGAQAASVRYFGKSANLLTIPEAALLAGLPKSPSTLRPDRYRVKALQRRNLVLRRMFREKFLDGDKYIQAVKSQTNGGFHSFPFTAPHLTGYLNQRVPMGTDLRSSIDLRLQEIAEQALLSAVRELKKQDVSNGAACIIETGTGFVRALVGSTDFGSMANDGQVNGALALRSPGSALKPFTYALALDRGRVSPTELLGDVPISFRGYLPRNYDRSYHGLVTVEQALRRSLNIPAIQVLNRTGLQQLYQLLGNAGIRSLNRPPEYYGLGLTLGSCGVSLLELTNAYAALARLGVYRPYRLAAREPVLPKNRIISEESAFLIADMLSGSAGSGRSPQRRTRVPAIRIASKTGTSYGHKDAWCLGFNPEYTVGVWLGNFNGLPSRSLVGREAAAPVVNRIFDKIYGSDDAPWYNEPSGISYREICSGSGLVATEHCARIRKDRYLPGISPCRPCKVHTRIMVDNDSGYQLCSLCSPGKRYRWKTVEVWPPQISTFLRSRGLQKIAPPPHHRPCKQRAQDHRNPDIVSPRDGQVFLLETTANKHQKLLLDAAVSPECTQLYWFVNNTFLTRAVFGQKVFWPLMPGTHEIVCADNLGRRTQSTITVRTTP
ncbi:MAG: penicillin-binding protein 1C [bacterium]|nr:penicillin-binding protein 1C [bacterium]